MSVRTADVAIVGGGLMGVWTAYFLARRGTRVAVLDKGLVGAQASGVNFGNLRLQGRHPGQYPLALRSHALWETIDDADRRALRICSDGTPVRRGRRRRARKARAVRQGRRSARAFDRAPFGRRAAAALALAWRRASLRNVLGAGRDGKPAACEPCRDEDGAASRRRPLPEHPCRGRACRERRLCARNQHRRLA